MHHVTHEHYPVQVCPLITIAFSHSYSLPDHRINCEGVRKNAAS